MISRDRRTPLSQWWWTVDRLLLAALTTLILGGIILSLAASPPVAARLGLDPFHFVNRHIVYLLPTIAVLLMTSWLSPRYLRRVALVVFLVSLFLVAMTPFFGAEIKGAKRWLVIAGVNVQPSASSARSCAAPDSVHESSPAQAPTSAPPVRWDPAEE